MLEAGKTSGAADTLVFDGGRFRSTACDRCGYGRRLDGTLTMVRDAPAGEKWVLAGEPQP